MANTVLEAFVKLFADDTELRKSFQGLVPDARRAGLTTGQQFIEGMERGLSVTPKRATGVQPLLLPTVGGRELDITSPFSKGGQEFRRARDLAEASRQPGGGLGGDDKLRKLAASTKEVSAGFHGARDAARIFGTTIASEVSPGFGEFVSASVHGSKQMGIFGATLGATLVIATLYAQRLKEATEFQVKFNLAAGSGDVGQAEALFKETEAGLAKLRQLKVEAAAGPGAIGGPPPFQAFFANLQMVFGAGVDELRKRAQDAAG